MQRDIGSGVSYRVPVAPARHTESASEEENAGAKSCGALTSLMLDRSLLQLRDEALDHTRPTSKATDARLTPLKGLEKNTKTQRSSVCKEAGRWR